MTLKEQWVQS